MLFWCFALRSVVRNGISFRVSSLSNDALDVIRYLRDMGYLDFLSGKARTEETTPSFPLAIVPDDLIGMVFGAVEGDGFGVRSGLHGRGKNLSLEDVEGGGGW